MKLLFRVFLVASVIFILGFCQWALAADLELNTAGQATAPTEPFYKGAN